MKLAKDWYKSKLLWFAVAPVVTATVNEVVAGTVKPAQGVLTIGTAVGAYFLRDTIARLGEKHRDQLETVGGLLAQVLAATGAQTSVLRMQTNVIEDQTGTMSEQHEERMGTINKATDAHNAAAAAVQSKADLLQAAERVLRAHVEMVSYDAQDVEQDGEAHSG